LKVFLVGDTHNNENKGVLLETHCLRPPDYMRKVNRNWNQTVKPEDLVIHLGDVIIGPRQRAKEWLDSLNGRKILIRGNHDRDKSNLWWSSNGFSFSCDGLLFRNAWLSHEPVRRLPPGAEINIHGHLHNIWSGFVSKDREKRDRELLGADYGKRLLHPWQRLFALEYCDYRPIEFQKFTYHPEKYQATGPKKEEKLKHPISDDTIHHGPFPPVKKEPIWDLYDPPSGWKYGFPKPYRPLPGETLEQTLLRDGYPQREIDNGGAKYCRFIGKE
jgi:calcineurin-like phosphoesterase family protein